MNGTRIATPIVLLLTGAPLLAQATFRSSSQEVLIDFVARDKHQKVIKDLKPEEVQIFEDGALQRPTSFRYRDGAEEPGGSITGPSAGHSAAGFDPLREINLVSIVFDNLSANSRRQASGHVQDFLETGMGPNTWAAVFTLHYQLKIVQPYTADRDLLLKAVKFVGTANSTEFAKRSSDVLQDIASAQAAVTSSQATFQPLQPGSAEERGPASDARLAAVQLATAQATLRMLFQQEGSRTIDALRRLVRAQAGLPGRKTVLFVCEGLTIPPQQPELLDAIIGEANRNNITFYTLDARGLSTASNVRIARMSNEAVNASLSGTAGPDVQATDRQANARHLAQGTGGFAMDNSNDLRGPLVRVMEDIRSHYEVTYVPSSANFDGRFRKLEVRVSRPGIHVASRQGYYALPFINGEMVAPYEIAALRALDQQPVPHAFPFHIAALGFDADQRGVNYRVVAAIPNNSLTATTDPEHKTFRLRAAVLALVKNEQGQIVSHAARDVPFEGPSDRLVDFRQGQMTIILPMRVPAGRYHLEVAALDMEAASASVYRSVLMVPPAAAADLRLSDVVWVRSVQAHTEPTGDGDPLDTPQGKATPLVSPSYPNTEAASFLFWIYRSRTLSEPPAVEILLSKDGTTLSVLRPDVAPSEAGAIPVTGRLPLSKLEPGTYEITVAARQGALRAVARSQLEVR